MKHTKMVHQLNKKEIIYFHSKNILYKNHNTGSQSRQICVPSLMNPKQRNEKRAFYCDVDEGPFMYASETRVERHWKNAQVSSK